MFSDSVVYLKNVSRYRSGHILWILLDPDPDLHYWFLSQKRFFQFFYMTNLFCVYYRHPVVQKALNIVKSTLNTLPLNFVYILTAVFLSRELSKTS